MRTPWPERRKPPMLDVALDELPRGRAQQMFARHLRLRHAERHHVLELIAKAVRAAGLVERRARPDAAGERLVEQPAVEQNVHRAIGRLHLNRAEDVVPDAGRRAARPRRGRRVR